MNFWTTLKNNKKPFFCVAPMADVTDAPFRQLIAKYSRHGQVGGGPDVMWTEFVSANGLMSKGRVVLERDLVYAPNERPIVAQLFTSTPHAMEGAAKLCAELGFDGVDINMGCPDKTIEKQGAGAAMIKTPDIAKAVIAAAKRGIASSGRDIPLSVKTRVGYNTVEIDQWITWLLQQDIAALTIHARTRKDMSKVPAQWEYIKKVVALRDIHAPHTIVIGNGDITSIADGKERAEKSGADGVMVGRSLFGNPWFFDEARAITATLPKKQLELFRHIPLLKQFFETKRKAPQSNITPITVEERMRVLVEHTKLFESMLGDSLNQTKGLVDRTREKPVLGKSFSIMKKHYKAYCTGFAGAKELRLALMETQTSVEVESLIKEFLL